jgi:hypothetical protein
LVAGSARRNDASNGAKPHLLAGVSNICENLTEDIMVGVNLGFPFSQQSLLVDASEVRPQGVTMSRVSRESTFSSGL